MPKFSDKTRSALKATRKLLKQNKPKPSVDSDTTESDKDSIESGEFSHIPLREELPSLANLFIGSDDNVELPPYPLVLPTLRTPSPEGDGNDMDQIMLELASITAKLATIQQKQSEQDSIIHSMHSENNSGQPLPAGLSSRSLIDSLSRIPDPIKSIPTFDGNRKQLNSWINTAEKTLATFKPLVSDNVYEIYEQAVLNKLEGRAKDAICMACDINSFEEAKEILINTLGDKFELSTYKAQLWKNKQGAEMSVHKYYQTTKLIVQNIKTLAKQDKTYAASWTAISKFIEEDSLAAFISGLNSNYFGFAQAAKPESLEDAYAFLCKFNSREKLTSNTVKKSNNNNEDRTNKFKAKYSNNKLPTKTENVEPMEVDPSLRSRLTLNKRNINNHELSESEDSSNDEQDENEINFHQIESVSSPT